MEMTVRGVGNRIALPKDAIGKKVAISMFDTRGRLIDSKIVSSGSSIVLRNTAEGIVIAKVKFVK
jgi:hypothetical protein